MPEPTRATQPILNCIRSPKKDRDWRIASAIAAGHFDPKKPVPPECDRRAVWWGIGDQQGTGSCVGFAVADLLRWHFVDAGIILQNQTFSWRYLWMASKETDEDTDRPTTFIERVGTSIKSALAVAYKFGIVLEDILPSFPEPGQPMLYLGDLSEFYATAAKYRIRSYFNLGDDLADWRKWIATRGPLVARLEVDEEWNKVFSNPGKGHLEKYRQARADGGHACLLVGYTQDYFIVRNSWGVEVGAGGFAFAHNGYAKEAFGDEIYGVVL